jgi:hypothetical protein
MALTPRFTFTSPNKINAIWTDGTFKLVFIPGTHSTLRNLSIYWDIMALGAHLQDPFNENRKVFSSYAQN